MKVKRNCSLCIRPLVRFHERVTNLLKFRRLYFFPTTSSWPAGMAIVLR